MKLAYFIFFVFMLIAALSAGFWFNRLPWVRNVKKRAEKTDETVERVRSTITLVRLNAYQAFASTSGETEIIVEGVVMIMDLRTQGSLGNDIVITHCLAPVAKLIERRISRSLGVGLAFTTLFQFCMSMTMIAKELSKPAKPAIAPSLSDLLFQYGLDVYGIPSFSVVVSAVVVLVFIYLYEELVSKYS